MSTDNRQKRTELIAQIQEKRKSLVITYVTSDRPGTSTMIQENVIPVLQKHIPLGKGEQPNIVDLFLYSRGGESDVPWSLVSFFRECLPQSSLNVLVPFRAHSAATVICLGADEIVMGAQGELGPIDATISGGPYNPKETEQGQTQPLPVSVEDVKGYFALLEKVGCERPEEKLRGFEKLAGAVHPLALGSVYRLLEQTRLVAQRLLSRRKDRFEDHLNEEIVRKLSSEIFSHRHAICRTEARDHIGLKNVQKAEDAGIAEELWSLYQSYADLFQLEVPFRPEEQIVLEGKDEKEWKGIKLACVESLKRMDLLEMDLKARRIRPIPPKIDLTINLPQIAIPQITGVDPGQIQALVQQLIGPVLNQAVGKAVDKAIQDLMKSIPERGFELQRFNLGWKEIK